MQIKNINQVVNSSYIGDGREIMANVTNLHISNNLNC